MKKGYLYVIGEENGGSVKVGISSKPKKRLSSLQVGNPNRLSIIYTIGPLDRRDVEVLERKTHSRYGMYRKSGEWFDGIVNIAFLYDYSDHPKFKLVGF